MKLLISTSEEAKKVLFAKLPLGSLFTDREGETYLKIPTMGGRNAIWIDGGKMTNSTKNVPDRSPVTPKAGGFN